jgi:ribosome biogenesis GTPase
MTRRETVRLRYIQEKYDIAKNRKPAKPGRKPRGDQGPAWRPDDLDDPGDPDGPDYRDDPAGDDAPRSERVMPTGERQRRRTSEATALAQLETAGSPGVLVSLGSGDIGLRGVVIEVSPSLCRVDLDGRILLCPLRGTVSAASAGFTNAIAVGDAVIVTPRGSNAGIVEAVLPRRSALARPDVHRSHLQQIIVANADQLLIVAAWRDPAIWLELVDRYLIAAERFHLDPVICVNKTDLAGDGEACRETMQPYVDLGFRVLFASAVTGDGVAALRDVLAGHTTVLAGLSGVGKSSLLTAVQPGLRLRTGAVAEYHIGRHTTSQVRMHRLDGGGYVIDTPGIREFGLSGLRQTDIAAFYPEIAALAASCRYSNCSHVQEEDCAVLAGLESGAVSEVRYHSYTRICESLPG